MTDIGLKCECGKVSGVATHVTPKLGNRIVCCCNDCQHFANFLRNDNSILDEYGGTDIYQMPLAYLKIVDGMDYVGCVRLTPKGMFRWFASCCNTPIGNTLSPSFPFIGLIHCFVDKDTVTSNEYRDRLFGPVKAYVHTKFAKQPVSNARATSSIPFVQIIKVFGKLIAWKLQGLNKPNAFFQDDGTPSVKCKILNQS